MVVPGLRSHLYRHEQTGYAYNTCNGYIIALYLLLEHIVNSQHTKTTPNSVSVERACISIVAFTRLLRSLVKVEHDSKTCHEEQEEHNPELADAALTAPCLPEKTYKSEQERQTVEHVVTLISLQLSRHLALVAQHPVVDERNTGYPVAMLRLAVALNIVLASGEVPHEVAPVHEVALIREEEADVLHLSRHLHHHRLAATVVRHLSTLNASHPVLVSFSMSRRVHTREEHILSIYDLVLMRNHEVRVFLVLRSLLLALPDSSTFLVLRHAHIAVDVVSHLRSVSLSVEQR